MLSVIVFALVVLVATAQEHIPCTELLDQLLECANKQDTLEAIVAIPFTCLHTTGATIEDLQFCGFLEATPAPEEGEESDVKQPVTLTPPQTKELSKPFTNSKKVIVKTVKKPRIYSKKVFVEPKKLTAVLAPPVYGIATAQGSASAAAQGASASADASAFAAIYN